MHSLIRNLPRIDAIQALAVTGVELLSPLDAFLRLSAADLRVHRVLYASTVDADPMDLLFMAPLVKAERRARVAQHITALAGRSENVPTILVIAGVDDADIALLALQGFSMPTAV